jgi:protein O-GlcNAc transferase
MNRKRRRTEAKLGQTSSQLFQRGNALYGQRKIDEAVATYRQAISIKPDYVEAHYNLGVALYRQRKFDEAIAAYSQAISIKPGLSEAHYNLGVVLSDQGKLDEAAAAYRQAISIKPDYAEAHSNLGSALALLGKLDEAVAACRQAIGIKPDYAEAYNNLGGALRDQGRVDEAVAMCRRAIGIRPDHAVIRSNLLFSLNYMADQTPEMLYAAHKAWDKAHAPALAGSDLCFPNPADLDRRLRIGYVSPDFREHSMSFFVAPLLASHDSSAVETVCYADVAREDHVTRQLRALADRWVNIRGLDTGAVVQQIRADKIDVLVDLAGHTNNNRLSVFARKPAPVQFTWLGYLNTTGLSAIDYRITDPVADPAGAENFHSETLVWLPRCFVCYRPPDQVGPVIPPPFRRLSHITFGSFNNIAKVGPQVVALWAHLLLAVPGSRLLLKTNALSSPAVRERIARMFAEKGIVNDRLTLEGWTKSPGHLDHYGRVDIALDPFPYNGGVTTCETLWMGVPVVTLRGDRPSARIGASLLDAVKLADLIADHPQAYVAIASALAHDENRLEALRAGMRERVRASSLCDAEGFAREMEAAYRRAWRARCVRLAGG